jgi:AbrB family looped-hinge helix DNA binding protein
MVLRVKVSSDHSIAIPDEIMRQLRIEPGSYLLVDVRDGYLMPLPEPADYAQHLRGLHREV